MIRTARRVSAVALLSAGLLLVSASALGAASSTCGEYSFGFTGTRLINDGISDSAGPFAITLPAGTYDITMWSSDNHPHSSYQVEQTNEQWFFVLDNGYQSPPTIDIPATGTATTTSVSAVQLGAATSITVQHVKLGGVNSVNVECVGFTPTPTVIPPETTIPAIAGPVTTTIPAAVPPTTAAPQITVAPPVTAAPPTTAVPVEVQPKVELPVPQLAATGPTNQPLAAAGFVLLALGLACVLAGHASERSAQRTRQL